MGSSPRDRGPGGQIVGLYFYPVGIIVPSGELS